MKHPLDVALAACIAGRPDESEAILRAQSQDDPRVRFNLGWHDLRHGDFQRGFDGLDCGRWINCFGLPPLGAGTPIWHGEPLKDKIVLFRSEGGYGDQIANVRFAEDFARRGAKVVVSCSRELFPLFRRLSYSLVGSDGAAHVDHDFWIPGMSAAGVLGYNYQMLSGMPFIPRADNVQLPGKFRVGLRWAGNPQFEHEQHRGFPSDLMLGLSDIPGATFYSLQRDEGRVPLPDSITDLEPFMDNWGATADLISSLDLVITSCTAVAHLSAALGVPTWVVVPIMPYYLWALPGSYSPWYDMVKLYRQEVYGEWDAPFEAIRDDLSDLLTANEPAVQTFAPKFTPTYTFSREIPHGVLG